MVKIDHPKIHNLPSVSFTEQLQEFIFPTSKSSRRFRAKVGYFGLSVATGGGSLYALVSPFKETMANLFGEHQVSMDQAGATSIAIGIGLGVLSLSSLAMARRQVRRG